MELDNVPVKSLVMDLGEEHVVFTDTGIAGKDFPKLFDVRCLINAYANSYLPGLLRRVKNVYEEADLSVVLGYRYRDAEEWVEGV